MQIGVVRSTIMVGLNVPITSTLVACTGVIQVEGMVSTTSKEFVVLKRQVLPLRPVVFVIGGLALTGKVRLGPGSLCMLPGSHLVTLYPYSTRSEANYQRTI